MWDLTMRHRFLSSALVPLLGALVWCFVLRPVAAQSGEAVGKTDSAKGSATPTPRAADGHPDFTGFWYNPSSDAVAQKSSDGSVFYSTGGRPKDAPPPLRRVPVSQPSYKPEFAAKVKEVNDKSYKASNRDDPEYRCVPMGVPRVTADALHIVQTAQEVVILYESNVVNNAYRIIYMDRPHPKDLEPAYLGDSVGHWEGDALVVDVIGLDDKTWLGGGDDMHEPPGYPREMGLPNGLIHSDQEHVVERYTRNGNMLTYEATVEDPVMFTKPWVITPRHIVLADPGNQIQENVCNDFDRSHLVDKDGAENQNH
jgi:hypothetical protein